MPNAVDDREQAGHVLREQESAHRRALHHRAEQRGEQAAHAVGKPAPALAAEEAHAEQHRQHGRADRRGNAEIAAERDEVLLRHRHGDAAQERRERRASRTRRWDASRTLFGCARSRPACAPVSAWISGGGCRKMIGERHDHRELEDGEADHGPLPAEMRDRALEDRRPDEAREIAAARDQRQRRAAAAVEPAADIDEQRRVQPGIAEQAHEQAVAELELPRRAAAPRSRGRPRSSRRRRSRSSGCRSCWRCGPSGCRRRPPPKQRERHRERRHRARAAGVGGDLPSSRPR